MWSTNDISYEQYLFSFFPGFGNADTVVILPAGTVNATIKKRGVNLNFLGRLFETYLLIFKFDAYRYFRLVFFK